MPGTDLKTTDIGPGYSLGFDGKPETQKASQHQPVFTSMGAPPTLAAGGLRGVLPSSIHVPTNQEGQVMDHSVSEGA